MNSVFCSLSFHEILGVALRCVALRIFVTIYFFCQSTGMLCFGGPSTPTLFLSLLRMMMMMMMLLLQNFFIGLESDPHLFLDRIQ